MNPQTILLKSKQSIGRKILAVLLAFSIVAFAFEVIGATLEAQSLVDTSAQFAVLNISAFFIGLVVFVVLGFISFKLARIFYRSQSLTSWFTLWAGIQVIIAALLLPLISLFISSLSIPPDLSFAVGLFLSFVFRFVYLGFIFSLFLIFVASFRYKKVQVKNPGSDLLAVSSIGVIASLLLLYGSGVAQYPADKLNLTFICHAIMSNIERSLCFTSTFEQTTDGPFDIIEMNIGIVSNVKGLDGKFALVARDEMTRKLTLYIDGVDYINSDTRDLYGTPVDVGSLGIAYTAVSDDEIRTLYINNEPFFESENYIALMNTPGTLTYAIYDEENSYLSEDNEIVFRGDRSALQSYLSERELSAFTHDYERTFYDRDTQTAKYTVGDLELTSTKTGIYLDENLIAPGLTPTRMFLVNDNVVVLASGVDLNNEFKRYLLIEKGAVTEEVLERIESL